MKRLERMSEIIAVCISAFTSLITSLITIHATKKGDEKKSKKEELYQIVTSNQQLFSEIIKISNFKNKFQIINLKEQLQNNLGMFLLLPKNISKLFFELYDCVLFTGENLRINENRIRNIATQIIDNFRKIGVGVSEFEKW